MRSVKSGFCRFFAACPAGRWWEALPDVVRALNVIPVRATGLSLHTVIFKAAPRLAVSWEVQQASDCQQETHDADPEEIGEEVGLW